MSNQPVAGTPQPLQVTLHAFITISFDSAIAAAGAAVAVSRSHRSVTGGPQPDPASPASTAPATCATTQLTGTLAAALASTWAGSARIQAGVCRRLRAVQLRTLQLKSGVHMIHHLLHTLGGAGQTDLRMKTQEIRDRE
eukprot:51640-Pelagomonas_calceolata.AAC.4